MSRSLDDLDPQVRPLVDEFLRTSKVAGLDLLITCTRRGMAEQAALYAQGRTAPGRIVTDAKPGTSAHNFGLAVDFVPIVNGKPDWIGADPCWAQAGNLAESVGLEWAGRWVSFKELAHVQLPDWKSHV